MNFGPAPSLPATSSQFSLAELLTPRGRHTKPWSEAPEMYHSKHLMRLNINCCLIHTHRHARTHTHTCYIVRPDYMFDIVLCHRQFRISQVSWTCAQHLDFLVKAGSPLWYALCTSVAHGGLKAMGTLQGEP